MTDKIHRDRVNEENNILFGNTVLFQPSDAIVKTSDDGVRIGRIVSRDLVSIGGIGATSEGREANGIKFGDILGANELVKSDRNQATSHFHIVNVVDRKLLATKVLAVVSDPIRLHVATG